MSGGHIGRALRRLRGLLGAECAGGPTDGELLRRFVRARDEAAFEALLRRHGPMVLGVCRRLLPSAQDVDDAFQATFLVLLRRAGSIGDGERVGNWLYGVAYRVSVRARVQAARRRAQQRPLTDVAAPAPSPEAEHEELRALLDEEFSRLPARYREAIVCCYLEGRTQEEAARLLGWPKGTVATRLNRARELLRTRLTRRGLALSGAVLAGLLGAAGAEAALPPGLVTTALHVAGAALSGSALPAASAALAGAVLRGFIVARVKAVAAGALALALVAGGGLLDLARRGSPAHPASRPPVPVVRLASSAVGREPSGPASPPSAAVRERPAPAPAREHPAVPPKSKAAAVRVVVVVVDGRRLLSARRHDLVWHADLPPGFGGDIFGRRPGHVVAITLSLDGKSVTSLAAPANIMRVWSAVCGAAPPTPVGAPGPGADLHGHSS